MKKFKKRNNISSMQERSSWEWNKNSALAARHCGLMNIT
jgi:hypothetical protein